MIAACAVGAFPHMNAAIAKWAAPPQAPDSWFARIYDEKYALRDGAACTGAGLGSTGERSGRRRHEKQGLGVSDSVDLFVIGGGVNGAGVARDAAGRGLSLVMCEKDDLAQGASSRWGGWCTAACAIWNISSLDWCGER